MSVMRHKQISPEQIGELCDAAQAAWDKLGPKSRKQIVRFKWNGRSFQSRLTSFRMLVETYGGKPICCRYF